MSLITSRDAGAFFLSNPIEIIITVSRGQIQILLACAKREKIRTCLVSFVVRKKFSPAYWTDSHSISSIPSAIAVYLTNSNLKELCGLFLYAACFPIVVILRRLGNRLSVSSAKLKIRTSAVQQKSTDKF